MELEQVIADIKKAAGEELEGFVFSFEDNGDFAFFKPGQINTTLCVLAAEGLTEENYNFNIDMIGKRFKWFRENGKFL